MGKNVIGQKGTVPTPHSFGRPGRELKATGRQPKKESQLEYMMVLTPPPPPDILAEPAGWVLLNSWYIHIRCISYLWRSYVAVTASQSHGVCPSPVPACNVVGTRSKMPWYLTFSFLARQAARGSMNDRSLGDANSELIKDTSMSLRQRSRWLWE